jgi:hypothetical protein
MLLGRAAGLSRSRQSSDIDGLNASGSQKFLEGHLSKALQTLIRKLKEHSRLTGEDLATINALSHSVLELKSDEDLIRQGDDPNVSAVVVSGMVARIICSRTNFASTSRFIWQAICQIRRRFSSIRWIMPYVPLARH